MPKIVDRLSNLLPLGDFFNSDDFISVIASKRSRCISSRSLTSIFHADPVSSSGRVNQLLPFSGNDPLFSPRILLLTIYFQYAQWTTISQILCRLSPGLQDASLALTPR